MPRAQKKYGVLGSPSGIAEAMEAAKKLPAPVDPRTLKQLGYKIRPGYCRAIIDLPVGIAWRAHKLRRARGIARSRIYEEIITLYLMHVPETALDGVPGIYEQFNTPQGIEVLARAMTMAIQRTEAPRGFTLGEAASADDEEVAPADEIEYPKKAKPVVESEPEPELEDFDVSALK